MADRVTGRGAVASEAGENESGKTTFEETRINFTSDEVAVARKWLVKYATNEAIFLVRNERGLLDIRVWVKGDGAEEVKGWTTKEMDLQISRMKWLIESPEEELRRAKLVRMFTLSLSPEVVNELTRLRLVKLVPVTQR